MPLLDKDAVIALRAKPRRICAECNNTTFENYCRTCDEFFWDGHVVLASLVSSTSEVGIEDEIKYVGIETYTCSCASSHQIATHRTYRLQLTEPWKYGDEVDHVLEVQEREAEDAEKRKHAKVNGELER